MTTIRLSGTDVASLDVDALVVAVAPAAQARPGDSGGTEAPAPRLLGAALLPAGLVDALEAVLTPLGVTGKADSVVRVPSAGAVAAPIVVLSGVGTSAAGSGSAADPSPEQLRRAVGAALRDLAGQASVAVVVPAADDVDLAAIAEGALLGAYGFRRYRTSPVPPAPVAEVTLVTGGADSTASEAVLTRARVVSSAVNATRDLVNTAPLDLYPAAFADAAVEAADGLPVEVTVLDDEQLRAGGYGGLVGVGQGSSRLPRLVRLDYAPEGAGAHVALVGKGITFDSGGLSIKPAAGMEAMKSDMAGAAAVLAAVIAAARLELPVRVSGWLALAENMPSGTAQRPSDVITCYGGRTVEVLNTDAEGRLVLADAIVAAGETGPDLIVDVATLTGAQAVALGNRVSAIMSNDDGLRERLVRVAAAVGEQFWPMPLPPELRAGMDSTVADIANIGDRFGGMLSAGLFLQEFVPVVGADGDGRAGASSDDTRLPWAHLDIAAPALTSTAHGYTPKGGTGVAVRTLLGLLEDLAGA